MAIAFNEFSKTQAIREKLKKGRFNRKLDSDLQLENALKQKILTHAEVEQFRVAKKFQQDAMQVDAF